METDEEIQDCFTVMLQLRQNLNESEFLDSIRRMYKDGYKLVAVVFEQNVIAVAGFHIHENLAWGKFLYVDDLITDQNQRSSGVGKLLLSWLHDEARDNHCDQLHLDSGVQRKDAHRFYDREGMTFASHHYVSKL